VSLKKFGDGKTKIKIKDSNTSDAGLFLPTPPYLLVPPHTKYENIILSFFFHPLDLK